MKLKYAFVSASVLMAASFSSAGAQAAPFNPLAVDAANSKRAVRHVGYYNDDYRPWWRNHRRYEGEGYGWRQNWWWRNRWERERGRYGWNDRHDWRYGDGRWR